ncbi:MAG: N-acetylmuramoyl-L-alanine amidase [Blautia sp.]
MIFLKNRYIELTMAVLLLAGVWLLSREVAQAVNAPAEETPVIVIDAGHGGSDPGMVGIGDLKEKGINLTIAKMLEDVLRQAGYQVVMTREEDAGLYDAESTNKKAQDMQRRCEVIAQAKPALTVSIHQNSYTDPAVCGPQVFYYSDSAEGEQLAKVLQEHLNQELQVERPREAKGNTSYYLLKRSEGVLNIVECGFLTNPKEAELLTSQEYQQKIAKAIAGGIEEYLKAGQLAG